ncbi:MAG: GNAT family N-acetyltransferase [Actinomycetota bacterium]|nr:GNAT family N-acetyltransferase [Actinomycetota bacterium]
MAKTAHRRRIDTGSITIRALRPDEGDLLDDLVVRMSPRSRYLRFHSPVRALDDRMRRALLDVDAVDHVALVAETPDGTPVGIARMIRDRHARNEAEVAIAVVDAWHRRGVGRRLLDALVQRTSALGITRLHAYVLPGNDAALGLFRAVLGVVLTRPDEDAVHLVGLVGDRDWEITTDDIMADLAG